MIMTHKERIKKLEDKLGFFYPPQTAFQLKLLEMGFSDTRMSTLDKGTRELYKAVCVLDKNNLELFFDNFPTIEKLLEVYSSETHLRRLTND